LRVLEDSTYTPVGVAASRTVNVRIVAATNQSLTTLMATRTFREELFYRLNVIEIVVPPLRDHKIDIPLLVNHFLHEMGAPRDTLTDYYASFFRYDWPGNVRELKNTVVKLLAHAPPPFYAAPPLSLVQMAAYNHTGLTDQLQAYERTLLRSALDQAHGSREVAAARLHVPLRTFYRKLKQFHLDDAVPEKANSMGFCQE